MTNNDTTDKPLPLCCWCHKEIQPWYVNKEATFVVRPGVFAHIACVDARRGSEDTEGSTEAQAVQGMMFDEGEAAA